ncbi:MAG: PIN domain-containing protein [Candidatus Aenigmatarchaeota archaeon]
MKRVILDTNIFGEIVDSKEVEEIKQLAERHKDIVIYGFDIIRKELRNITKDVRTEGKLVRLMLLGLYDKLVRFHAYFATAAISQLADEYYEVYQELGGKRSKKEMMNDFLIVACASIHELDIVVSNDTKTMRSDIALKSYEIVNKLKKYRMPGFIGYESFRRLIS